MQKINFYLSLLICIFLTSCGTGAYSIYGLTGRCPYSPNQEHYFITKHPKVIEDTLCYDDPYYYISLNSIDFNRRIFGIDNECSYYIRNGIVYTWTVFQESACCMYCNASNTHDIYGIERTYCGDIKDLSKDLKYVVIRDEYQEPLKGEKCIILSEIYEYPTQYSDTEGRIFVRPDEGSIQIITNKKIFKYQGNYAEE